MQTIHIIQALFRDFPQPEHPSVRLVILVTVFCGALAPESRLQPSRIRNQLEPFAVLPLSREDLLKVLSNPFIEKPGAVFAFARSELGMNPAAIQKLAGEAAVQCLELSCKVSVVSVMPYSYGGNNCC